jgi:hypothetical protein
MKTILVAAVVLLAGCAHRPTCPPQQIRTESVCVGQQTIVRFRDFIEDPKAKHICPPIYVITAQMCGR